MQVFSLYEERKWCILLHRDLSNQKEVSGLGKDDCLALFCLEIFALGIQYLKSVVSLLSMMILFNNVKKINLSLTPQVFFQKLRIFQFNSSTFILFHCQARACLRLRWQYLQSLFNFIIFRSFSFLPPPPLCNFHPKVFYTLLSLFGYFPSVKRKYSIGFRKPLREQWSSLQMKQFISFMVWPRVMKSGLVYKGNIYSCCACRHQDSSFQQNTHILHRGCQKRHSYRGALVLSLQCFVGGLGRLARGETLVTCRAQKPCSWAEYACGTVDRQNCVFAHWAEYEMQIRPCLG